jgi:dolichyl-phosphate-mannose-protein mannosyltransferase
MLLAVEARRDVGAGDSIAPRRSWTLLDWFLMSAITLAGGLARLAHLRYPRDLVFDETYYAKDACWYVEAAQDVCGMRQTEAHPPLGKWLIGTGIELFGFESLGWRIVVLIAGTVTIALLYVLAQRVMRSTLAASVASALLALDLLHFVQSRTAMLDVFLPLFGVAATLFVVIDRDDHRSASFLRPWRLAAGAAAGAAVTVKWSGVLILIMVFVLAAVWSRHRRDEIPTAPDLGPRIASLVVSFFALPALIYLLSYAGRLDGTLLASPWAEGSWFRSFFDQHGYMLEYHRNLEQTHSYQSPPYTWLLLKRPVAYFFETAANGDYREIMATGNPFVWWPSVAALIYVAVDRVTAPERARASGVILAGFGFTYLPWLLIAFTQRSAVFLFYLLPTVPFMCLALAYVARRVARFWEGRVAVALFAAVAIASFLFYRPLLIGDPLRYEDWRQRLCLAGQSSGRCLFAHPEACEKPDGKIESITETVTTEGTVSVTSSESNSNESLPPKGWCWI